MNDAYQDIINFSGDFRLVDFREEPDFGNEMFYRIYLIVGNQHCMIRSESLKEEDLGTRQSFENLMDSLRYQLLKKLCPKAEQSTPLPP